MNVTVAARRFLAADAEASLYRPNDPPHVVCAEWCDALSSFLRSAKVEGVELAYGKTAFDAYLATARDVVNIADAIREGEADVRAGRVRDYDEVRSDLGLPARVPTVSVGRANPLSGGETT